MNAIRKLSRRKTASIFHIKPVRKKNAKKHALMDKAGQISEHRMPQKSFALFLGFRLTLTNHRIPGSLVHAHRFFLGFENVSSTTLFSQSAFLKLGLGIGARGRLRVCLPPSSFFACSCLT